MTRFSQIVVLIILGLNIASAERTLPGSAKSASQSRTSTKLVSIDGAPSDADQFEYIAAKFDLGLQGTATISTVEGNNTFLASSFYTQATDPVKGISRQNKGFVKAVGTQFYVGNKPFFCAGTNAYYAALKNIMSDSEVVVMMKEHASRGANVLRVFAHNDFSSDGMQPSLGVYNEQAIRRLDLAMVAAADNGIRLILVLTNFWPFVGGMQKWVDYAVGPGNDIELFYTNPTVRDYYKKWVKHIVTRTNSITGQKYTDDPTIFGWELANEPRTNGQYEMKRGLVPGRLICNWVGEMSSYIKSLDPNHMITTGEEGHRSDGDVNNPHAWLNDGYTGLDMTCNINKPDIDFATLHIYADQWNIPSPGTWLAENYIKDRALLAKRANKPIILEEYGLGGYNYVPTRDDLFSWIQKSANANGYACFVVWAVSHYSTDPNNKGFLYGSNDGQGYVFGYEGDGSNTLLAQYRYMKDKNLSDGRSDGGGGGGGSTSDRGPSSQCIDVPVPGDQYSCEQQAGWGQCDQPWMSGYCLKSCGNCSRGAGNSGSSSCVDVSVPGDTNTCQQQAGWAKCDEPWIAGYCLKSCGKC